MWTMECDRLTRLIPNAHKNFRTPSAMSVHSSKKNCPIMMDHQWMDRNNNRKFLKLNLETPDYLGMKSGSTNLTISQILNLQLKKVKGI